MLNIIKQKLLYPLQNLKAQYLPLLMVYFGAGFAGITSVTMTFFLKNNLSLSAAQLVEIGIWAAIPWTIKMVFGTIIDGMTIFGSNRKSYILIGASLMSLGTLLWVDIASTRYTIEIFGEYTALLLSMLITQIGVVVQDITADTMTVEVIDEDIKDRDAALGIIQVLSRLFFQFGALIAAFLTGYLASNFLPHEVFAFRFLVPLVAISGVLFIKVKNTKVLGLDKRVLAQGLIFGASIIASNFIFEDSQLVVFGISITYIIYLLKGLISQIQADKQIIFMRACAGIFLFRCVPYAGDGVSWWLIKSVGMTPDNFASLRQIAFISSIAVVWFFADIISKSSIRFTLGMLALLDVVFQLPEIGIFYQLNEYMGIDAKSLIYVTTAMTSPIGGLSMIPLGILVAKYAPQAKKALYFSVTASFMNVALQAGSLITKYMNQELIVTRVEFANLGTIMLCVLTLSIIFPILGILTIKKDK